VPGATLRQAMTVRTTTGGIMVTWTWILIAVAVVAGLVVHTVRRPKKPMYDTESAQDTAQSSEQIANAGTDSQDRASSVLRPLPDTQTGPPDRAWHAAIGSDLGTGAQPYAQLLENHEMQRILGQWKDIQAEFVDEPRKAVQDADALVAELMQRLAQTFASQREQLESQWAGVDDVSTENLRQSLRRYHSFFDRLLAP
jgi:hypothetical protein